MQEFRHDGSQVVTEQSKLRDMFKAVKDLRNKMVTIHLPGSLITKEDGSRHVVQFDGRLRPARPEEV